MVDESLRSVKATVQALEKLARAADRQLAIVNEISSPSPRKEFSLEDYKGIFDGPPYDEVMTIVRARLKDLNLEHEGIALCEHASLLQYASIQFGGWKLYENVTDQDYKDASAIMGDFPRRTGDKKTDEGIEFMVLESARSHHKQVRDSIEELLQLLEQPTPKRSSNKTKDTTAKSKSEIKLIAALTKHHDYASGRCLKFEAIGSNELARLAGVSNASASRFFKKKFASEKISGYKRYVARCVDSKALADWLGVLNNEFTPAKMTELFSEAFILGKHGRKSS